MDQKKVSLLALRKVRKGEKKFGKDWKEEFLARQTHFGNWNDLHWSWKKLKFRHILKRTISNMAFLGFCLLKFNNCILGFYVLARRISNSDNLIQYIYFLFANGLSFVFYSNCQHIYLKSMIFLKFYKSRITLLKNINFH
jgi:hypothetical protein